MQIAVSLDDLRVPPGNRLEALAGDRQGQHSIRINDRHRVCFAWSDAGPDEVEIEDYHEPQRERDMIRIPTHREPTHPGEILLEEYLEPMGLTQRQLAEAIRVPYQRVNEIVNKRRGITPSTALRLAKFFGVSADYWLNLQLRWDIYQVQQKENSILQVIQPHTAAKSA